MKYELVAERAGDRLTIARGVTPSDALAIVNRMKNRSKWPEGRDALLADVETGNDQRFLDDGKWAAA
jgi:hypothetical protein